VDNYSRTALLHKKSPYGDFLISIFCNILFSDERQQAHEASAFYRQGQGTPIVKGGVRNLVAEKLSVFIRDGDVAHFAPPTFNERNHQAIGDHCSSLHGGIGFRHVRQTLADKPNRALNFDPADKSP